MKGQPMVSSIDIPLQTANSSSSCSSDQCEKNGSQMSMAWETDSVKDESPSTETAKPYSAYDEIEDKSGSGSDNGSLKSLNMDDDRPEEIAPVDKMWIVYAIVLLNGIGVLLPWNMFITIAPDYYVGYWFSPNGTEDHYGKGFMSALGITSQIPNFLMGVVSVLAIIKGPILWRIAGSLTANCLLVGVILVLIVAQDPSEDAEHWFYIVSLIIVMAMNASNGLYQNSVFGLAADMPFSYTNALVIGNNVCGTFTSVVSIVTTIALNGNSKTVALIYFSISLVVLLICGASLVLMTRMPFYQFYMEKGARARAADNSNRPSLRQYWETVKACWMQFLNIFLTFFVTLSVFPTILVGMQMPHIDSKHLEDVYYGLTVFLNFNLFAAIGSFSAGFVQFPPPKWLCIPVFARLLFIPFFMFCQYDIGSRTMGTIFDNQWWFIIGNMVLAFTAGYFSSLGMMYAPGSAPPHLQKTAGQCAALSLVGGIMAGVGFTPLITKMVESIH